MAHQYSVEIHQKITQELAQVQAQLPLAQGEDLARLQGQEQELVFFRNYLSEHFDLKHFEYF